MIKFSSIWNRLKQLVGNQKFKTVSVFVIPFIVAAITSYAVGVHTTRLAAQLSSQNGKLAAQLAAQLANQNKTVSDFQTDARSVDASIAAYAYSVIDDGKPDEVATANLRANLIEQYDEVDLVAPFMGPQYRNLIPAYKQQIDAMTEVIPATTNILDMKIFWETASKLLTLRNQITSNLPG